MSGVKFSVRQTESLQEVETHITKKILDYGRIRKYQRIVTQVAIQAAMVVMMVLRDTEAGPQTTNVVSHRKPHSYRHSGPVLAKPTFNWGVKDRYIEIRNFEIEVLNVLETIACKLSERDVSV